MSKWWSENKQHFIGAPIAHGADEKKCYGWKLHPDTACVTTMSEEDISEADEELQPGFRKKKALSRIEIFDKMRAVALPSPCRIDFTAGFIYKIFRFFANLFHQTTGSSVKSVLVAFGFEDSEVDALNLKT